MVRDRIANIRKLVGKVTKEQLRYVDCFGIPNAFFSVNVVARKQEKNRPESNPYLQKFLRRIAWRPRELAVFAGRIDYPSYRFLDRLMIRLIMWMNKGPTDPKAVVEFTNWQNVEEFGRLIGRM